MLHASTRPRLVVRAWCVLAVVMGLRGGAAGSDGSPRQITLLEWNVGWFALDDSGGRSAIVHSIDGVGLLDFAVIIEASGSTPKGALGAWSPTSRVLDGLTLISTHTGHETLALFYNATRWTQTYALPGAFESGRPWLLAHFTSSAGGGSSLSSAGGDSSLWVLAVHMPHFLDLKYRLHSPGAELAAALSRGANASGYPVDAAIVTGDFNEFQWEDNPCPRPYYPKDCREQAAKRMAPLWDGFFAGGASDVATDHTVTCCTKWGPKDRHTTAYTEWRFEYDHVFIAGALRPAAPARLLPYAYPGTAAPCATPTCTGEDPPQNVTASHQGSIHRGWVVELQLAT